MARVLFSKKPISIISSDLNLFMQNPFSSDPYGDGCLFDLPKHAECLKFNDDYSVCEDLQCVAGWRGDPYQCENIDECFQSTHTCPGLGYDSLSRDYLFTCVFIFLNLVCLFFKRQFDKLSGYTWILYLRMYFTWMATKRSNSTKRWLSMCEC